MKKLMQTLFKQDTERYRIPRRVQDIIPIQCIWDDGIFKVDGRFTKSFKFTDINYLVASRSDKEQMFLGYSELLNSLDSGAATKLTIYNHRISEADFEESNLMQLQNDVRDPYRAEYNGILLEKALHADGIMQEKFITISIAKKSVEEARSYFARVGAELQTHFAVLGSKCTEMTTMERLRVLHDFYRCGEENNFHFVASDMRKKGHDFRDYICPDSIELHADHLKLGERYARVLYLKDYAAFIKDSMVSELTELNRSMMLSIIVCTMRKQ